MKTKLPILIAALLLSILNSQLSTAFAQGGLTPPGAPAPLFKTLQQVEPRTPISSIPFNLTNSGSYYLTGNLTQTSNLIGITIQTSDVTIDLNGFALIGTNGTAEGITGGGTARTNIFIRNGTIRNWSTGVLLNGGGLARLEHLTISGNSSHGIQMDTPVVVANCSVIKNGGHGIFTFNAVTVVRGCLVLENSLDAIRVGANSLVVENHCQGKASSGSTNAGIRVTSNNSRIENNHVLFYENGVVVSGGNNFIFRNTAAFVGTNYIFAVGNSFGPTNTTAGVVIDHPWANFSQ